MKTIIYILITFFLFLTISCYSQDDNKKYMHAISLLIDSGQAIKYFFKSGNIVLKESNLSNKKDSSCYFTICDKIQYLGMPNLMKKGGGLIDSAIVNIPKADLSNSRIFYKKYYFTPYNLNIKSTCKLEAKYKLILSKPIHNILTIMIAPIYTTIVCERPKFGKIVKVTFIYNEYDEILDYGISSMIRN